tara:strand:- start:79 stop:198 length:120 start_codon:yes stop_codon:yes gene_type:complete
VAVLLLEVLVLEIPGMPIQAEEVLVLEKAVHKADKAVLV